MRGRVAYQELNFLPNHEIENTRVDIFNWKMQWKKKAIEVNLT